MDWNWFYSSLSQSSAAIVGIFAAFVMTKIVSNQVEFARKKRLLDRYINQSKRLIDEARSSPISRYGEDVFVREVMKVRNLLKKKQIDSPKQAVNILKFSEFADIHYMIEKFERILATCRQQTATSERSMNECFLALDVDKYTEDQCMRRQASIERDKAKIYEVLTDVKDHIRTARLFLDDLSGNPESSWLMRYVLIGMLLLFWICVVLPLCLLPNTSDNSIGIVCFLNRQGLLSSKSFMLISLGLVFTLLFAVMGYANEVMKYDEGRKKELEGYLDISSYSEYYNKQSV